MFCAFSFRFTAFYCFCPYICPFVLLFVSMEAKKSCFFFGYEHLKNKTNGKIRLLSAVWHFTHDTDTSPGGSSSIQSCGAFSFFRNF